jgi:hypothetical protein
LEDRVFFNCQEEKLNSKGQPFWDKLAEKWNYTSGEALRNAWRRDERRRAKSGKTEEEKSDLPNEETSFEQDDDFINVICASKRILTKEEIIEQFNIDLSEWEIKSFKIKTSEGYRKDRKVRWVVQNGNVIEGDVDDTGKMLVVPLYHIEVRLVKKIREVQAKNSIEEMILAAKTFAPKYPKINYVNHKDGFLYELGMPDVHFGRLTWDEESGENCDIKLARETLDVVLDKLLSYSKNFEISKILFPVGNDFYNVDNKSETTTHGTPQQEDSRWQKTFRRGREVLVGMIDRCSQIAPVDVIIVPGNHDEQRSFYLGDSLECWYHNCPNVKIDNRAISRKYYLHGKVLLGFTHGYYEKLEKLPLLMAMEVPDLWAKSIYREIHTGDKHNKKDLVFTADEGTGIVVRILRSLAVADAWTFNKGFKSLRAAESFLWHPENGLTAQFTALP